MAHYDDRYHSLTWRELIGKGILVAFSAAIVSAAVYYLYISNKNFRTPVQAEQVKSVELPKNLFALPHRHNKGTLHQ